jgi:sulfide:quinone oxidoreductase
VRSLDPARRVAILDDETEMPYDLFLGIPKHRVPDVVAASGMTEDGWIPVNPLTLETRFPGVYAVGDVTSVGTPKAGVFSEGAARVVAKEIIASIEKGDQPDGYDGRGFCYIEFGGGQVGSVEVQFLSGQPPKGTFYGASLAKVEEKKEFGATRRARWFGLETDN